MARQMQRINWTSVIIGAMILGFFGLRGETHAVHQQDRNARVATVNLETIFEGLLEREAADEQLNALAADMDAQGQTKRDEIEEATQDRDLYPTGSTKYQELTTEIARLTFDLKAFREFALRVLDSRKSESLRDLYTKIKASIEEYALAEGYVVVFVDDSVVALPLDASEAETTRQISARRMLFTDPRIDITDEIVAFMNARFANP